MKNKHHYKGFLSNLCQHVYLRRKINTTTKVSRQTFAGVFIEGEK